MTTDQATPGDPARSLALLWGDRHAPARKGKHSLTVARIVDAAIDLADTAGVEALSMRKVAETLGVGTMSLYTYVPGKSELVAVMIDTVYARAAQDPDPPGGWRVRLETLARHSYRTHLAHPWILHVSTTRATLGPGAAAKYERELAALEPTGLADGDMDAVVNLISGHVEAQARRAADIAANQARTGMSEEQWWQLNGPLLAGLADYRPYPLAARVGASAGQQHGSAFGPDHDFEFGLQRILDGVAALIRSRT